MAVKTVASSSYMVSTSTAVSGRGRTDPPGRLHPVEHRHPDVDEQHVGPGELDLAHRTLAVLGLADHLDAVDGRQQGAEAAAHDRVVVGEHHADRHVPMMTACTRGRPGSPSRPGPDAGNLRG